MWLEVGGFRRCRGYGFSNFVGDSVLTILTCGIWLIWIIIREARL